MKICTQCKIEKLLDQYYFNKNENCYYAECKQCISNRSKKYKENNKNILKEKRKEYVKNNPEKVKSYKRKQSRTPKGRFDRSVRQAKRRNIEWTISFEDFCKLIELQCYYCNNLLCDKVNTSHGLDRMDNSKGYHMDNVLPCGRICNQIKNNFLTVQETVAAVKAILQIRVL